VIKVVEAHVGLFFWFATDRRAGAWSYKKETTLVKFQLLCSFKMSFNYISKNE
jgi:hypothetical protein